MQKLSIWSNCKCVGCVELKIYIYMCCVYIDCYFAIESIKRHRWLWCKQEKEFLSICKIGIWMRRNCNSFSLQASAIQIDHVRISCCESAFLVLSRINCRLYGMCYGTYSCKFCEFFLKPLSWEILTLEKVNYSKWRHSRLESIRFIQAAQKRNIANLFEHACASC